MVSNLFPNLGLDGENLGESKAIRLRPWEEARGCLKEVDEDRDEIVLEVRKRFKIKLPSQELDELDSSIGEEISILRTGESVDDDFLMSVEEGKRLSCLKLKEWGCEFGKRMSQLWVFELG